MHGRAEIWNLSSSVHIDIEREHEKINSLSPNVHVLFCLLYKEESATRQTKTMPYSGEPDKCISLSKILQ